jgi:hypothetical protein
MRISTSHAKKLFVLGHPVRLISTVGASLYGYNSAALRNYGHATFEEFEQASRARHEQGNFPTHWERPSPSRRTYDEAMGHVFRRESFEIGNLSATMAFVAEATRGDLPEKYHASFDEAMYAVWSWETPIAWLDPKGAVVIPSVRYSITTTQHQYQVARALGVDFLSGDESARIGKGKSPYGPRSWQP